MKEKKIEKSEEKICNKEKKMKSYEESAADYFAERAKVDEQSADYFAERAKVDEQLEIIARAKIILWKIESETSLCPPDKYVYYFGNDGEPACFKNKKDIELSKSEYQQLINCLMNLRNNGFYNIHSQQIVDYIFDLLRLEIANESEVLFEEPEHPITRKGLIKYLNSDLDDKNQE